MKLKLLARHFKDTSFVWDGRCAIEKAFDEILIGSNVRELVYVVCVNNNYHSHSPYEIDQFVADKLKAEKKGFDNSVIRIIDIPTLQEPKTQLA